MAQLYVNPEKLSARLPSKEGGWDADVLIAYVQSAADYVDSRLSNYWGFPDYNAAVPTPQIVQQATLDYAVYLAKGDLGEDNEEAEDTSPEKRLERCNRVCDDLVEERAKIKARPVAAEALTFGSDPDWPDLAFLSWTEVEVIEEASQIEGYEYGADFVVGYSARHRKWAVKRLISEIVDEMQVTYQISWLRRHEIDEDVTRTGSIEVERA